MNTIDRLNDILDISNFPFEIKLNEKFEVVFVLTLIDESTNSGYIPDELGLLLKDFYQNSSVWLHDSEPRTDNKFRFVDFGGKNQIFRSEMIDELLDNTGLWGFVAEFQKDRTFLIGLDHEYILIISPKKKGLYLSSVAKRLFGICW